MSQQHDPPSSDANKPSQNSQNQQNNAETCRPINVSPDGRIVCPACGGAGVERKQKWFCSRCGMLLMTCCD